MTTETEYGPPIAVNGKRPEWLGCDDLVSLDYGSDFVSRPVQSRMLAPLDWMRTKAIRLRADHPYYQSAEYKASEYQRVNELLGNYNPLPVDFDRSVDGHVTDFAVKHLEAAGYTVTPPDPLAADREFLAGLMRAANGWLPHQTEIEAGKCTDKVSAAMDYLRQNKGRL